MLHPSKYVRKEDRADCVSQWEGKNLQVNGETVTVPIHPYKIVTVELAYARRYLRS